MRAVAYFVRHFYDDAAKVLWRLCSDGDRSFLRPEAVSLGESLTLDHNGGKTRSAGQELPLTTSGPDARFRTRDSVRLTRSYISGRQHPQHVDVSNAIRRKRERAVAVRRVFRVV